MFNTHFPLYFPMISIMENSTYMLLGYLKRCFIRKPFHLIIYDLLQFISAQNQAWNHLHSDFSPAWKSSVFYATILSSWGPPSSCDIFISYFFTWHFSELFLKILFYTDCILPAHLWFFFIKIKKEKKHFKKARLSDFLPCLANWIYPCALITLFILSLTLKKDLLASTILSKITKALTLNFQIKV